MVRAGRRRKRDEETQIQTATVDDHEIAEEEQKQSPPRRSKRLKDSKSSSQNNSSQNSVNWNDFQESDDSDVVPVNYSQISGNGHGNDPATRRSARRTNASNDAASMDTQTSQKRSGHQNQINSSPLAKQNALRKRKRTLSQVQSTDSEASESDEEWMTKKKTAKKAKDKQLNVKRKPKSNKGQRFSRQRRGSIGTITEPQPSDDAELCLLMKQIKATQTPVKLAADNWIEENCSGPSICHDEISQGIRDLIVFCLQASTNNRTVTVSNRVFQSEDPVNVIDNLARFLPAIAADSYLVIKKDRSSKSFTTRFADFWSKIVQVLPETLLYEESSFETLLEWLFAMSKAKRQSFRHTAVIALYNIMDGLIEMVLAKEHILTITVRRLETEKKKKGKAKNNEKILQYSRDKKELDDHISSLDHFINSIFENVFSMRLRDIHPVIREASILALGNWAIHYSPFLRANRLKYLGWSLNDADANVRKATISSLIHVFRKWPKEESLCLFLEKFGPRLLGMMNDVDSNVVTLCLELITLLLQSPTYTLDEEKLDEIPRLLWDSSSAVRKAVARHMYETAFSHDGEEDYSELQVNMNDLKSLVSLFTEASPLQENNTQEELYIAMQTYIESLWGEIPCVQNWESYMELLVPSDDQQVSLDDIETNGLEDGDLLLLCALRAAAEKSKAEHVTSITSKIAKAKKESAKKNCDELNASVSPRLYQLLISYQADSAHLQQLLPIFECLDLESVLTDSSTVEGVVVLLKNIFLKAVELELLEACARSLHYLSSQSSHFRDVASQATQSAVETALENVAQFFNNIETAHENTESVGAAILDLQRCCAIGAKILFSELTSLFEIIIEKLTGVLQQVPVELCISSLRFLQVILLWKIQHYVKRSVDDESSSTPASCTLFLQLIEKCLKLPTTIKKVAFEIAGDIVFICDTEHDLTACVQPSLRNKLRAIFRESVKQLLVEESKDSSLWASNPLEMFLATTKSVAGSFHLNQSYSADLIACLGRFDSTVDMLIRQTISRMKAVDIQLLVSCHLHALQKRWEEDPEGLKEFSSRLVLTLGMDLRGVKLQTFFEDGIEMAFHPSGSNFNFLNNGLVPYIQRASEIDVEKALSQISDIHFTGEDGVFDSDAVKAFESSCTRRLQHLKGIDTSIIDSSIDPSISHPDNHEGSEVLETKSDQDSSSEHQSAGEPGQGTDELAHDGDGQSEYEYSEN